MQGIRDACEAEGVAIVGGHTVDSQETMIGFLSLVTANGAPLRKTNAHPGDLSLCKQQ